MTKSVLITGGYGFLGRAAGRHFKRKGYRVLGLGNGRWNREEFQAHGFDEWLDASVTMSSLMTLEADVDVVAHCAGNGSVSYSHNNPRQDFTKSVDGLAALLEFMRLNIPSALLIYPSSASVYGEKADAPIQESDPLSPMSTYGYHKRIAEELCENYARIYGLRIAAIRFFSIYGPGLTKQLLWDASVKLLTAKSEAVFWGTGEETRDWMHIDDATETLRAVAESADPPDVINGATGERVTVRTVLEMLREALNIDVPLTFNGIVRTGDPRFYHADVTRLRQLGVQPTVSLSDGLKAYAAWFKGTWKG